MFKIFLIITFILLLTFSAFGQNKSSDQERLVRIETCLDEGLKNIDEKFKNVDRRLDEAQAYNLLQFTEIKASINNLRQDINDLRELMSNFILWTVSLIVTSVLTMIGFVLWDRRAFLVPIATEM